MGSEDAGAVDQTGVDASTDATTHQRGAWWGGVPPAAAPGEVRTEDVGAVDGDTPAAAPREDDAANRAALARHGFVEARGEITRARAPQMSREQAKVALATRVEGALGALVSDLPHVSRRMEEPRALLADLLAMLLDDADEADHANG